MTSRKTMSATRPDGGRLWIWLASSLLLAAAFFWAAAISPAKAQPVMITGQLAQSCKSANLEEQAFCAGYIAGTLHTMTIPADAMPKGGFCMDPTQGVTVSAMADNLVAITEQDPAVNDVAAYIVLAKMLEVSFPCDGEGSENGNASE